MYFENKKAARGDCSRAAWRCALPLENRSESLRSVALYPFSTAKIRRKSEKD